VRRVTVNAEAQAGNVDSHHTMNHVPAMGMNIAPSRAKTASNRRQITKSERKSLQASPIVRKALELMVWEGHRRDDAAKAVGMLPKSLYNALRKHHVKRYYFEQLDVLRTSERARNIHALVRVRDQDQNKTAVVAAVKALEKMKDDQAIVGVGQARTPGVVIVVGPAEPAKPRTIDASPAVRRVARDGYAN
jgi:hypothetical protein